MEPNDDDEQTADGEQHWTTDDSNTTRQSFLYYTSKMISELPLNKDFKFSRAFLASASQVLLEEALRMARDAEHFAAHAQRSKVNMADIRLLFRNQPAFQAEMEDKNQLYKQQKRLIEANEVEVVGSVQGTEVQPKKPRSRKSKISRTSETPLVFDADDAPFRSENSKDDAKTRKAAKKSKSKKDDVVESLVDAEGEIEVEVPKKRKRAKKSTREHLTSDACTDIAVLEDDNVVAKTSKKRKNARVAATEAGDEKPKARKKLKAASSAKQQEEVVGMLEELPPSKSPSKCRTKLPFNLLADSARANAADCSFDSPTFSQLGLDDNPGKSTRISRKASPKTLFSQSTDKDRRHASSDDDIFSSTNAVETTARTDYDKLMEGIDD